MKSNKQFKFYVFFNCFILGSFLLFFTSQSMADTYCVANETDLIDALDDAEGNGEDDVIQIQQGTYYGNFVYTSTESFGVTIEGGYTVGCASRDVALANTVLDARGSGVVLALSAPGVAANFVVDGVTIQNGMVSGYDGAGVVVLTEGTVFLGNNHISNNNCYDDAHGGGASVRGASSLELKENIINGNLADYGAGVYAYQVDRVIVNKNTFENNTANRDGGAIYIQAADYTTIKNNKIKNNSARNGGGIRIGPPGLNVEVENNSINLNTANESGGGIYYGYINCKLINNHFSQNESQDGGAIFGVFSSNSSLNSIIVNNVVTNNIANNKGGGIKINYGHQVLVNNTIIDNTGAEGSEIWLQHYEDISYASIYNNIILNNLTNNISSIFILNDGNGNFHPSPIYLFNNDFDQSEQGTYIQIPFPIPSSNLNNVDPSFVDPPNDDYHLQEGSVLINAGNNTAPELPATDKDGNARIVGSAVDIGAYEYQGFVAPLAAFMASPLVGVAPLTVEFFDESTGSIGSWDWDFGDGNDSTSQNDTNTYNDAGTYSVSLTVTGNSDSDTETKTDYITVVSPDAPDLSCMVKEFHCVEFGQKIVVKLQVENSGNTKALPFDVAFYLSNNGITQDELLELDTVNGGLNSQRTKVVSLRYESGSSLSGKYIIAVIDPDGRVLELDENNNYFSIRVP